MRRLAFQIQVTILMIAAMAIVLTAGRQARATHEGTHFTATLTGPFPNRFLVPLDPPMATIQEKLTGQCDLFVGPVRWTDKHTMHFGVDGQPLSFTNGVGVIYDNRDSAVFVHFSGFASNPATGVTIGEDTFQITGGRGDYEGAYGSGRLRVTLDQNQNTTTMAFDGILIQPGSMVVPPRAATSAFRNTVEGGRERVGGGDVISWAKVQGRSQVTEVGVTIPFSLVQNPPAEEGFGPARAISVLPFPEIVRATTYFQHFELMWEPMGHQPPRYLVPHFDFHFYNVPVTENLQVFPPDKFPPDPSRIPPGYVYPGIFTAAPQMGAHAFPASDLQSPDPFGAVLLVGFWEGNMTFLEPMATRDFLASKRSFVVPVPRPAVLGLQTRYPTRFSAVYTPRGDAYQLVFSQFVSVTQ